MRLNRKSTIQFVLLFILFAIFGLNAKAQAAILELPKEKQTTMGLYLTAKEAYEKRTADPDKVKVTDVFTKEEYFCFGHSAMAWNVALFFQTYEWDTVKLCFPLKPNSEFLAQVKNEWLEKPRLNLYLCYRS